MFICDFCKKTSEPGEKLTKIPVKTRPAKYPQRTYKSHGETIFDHGGTGTEIVVEKNACEACAKEREGKDEQSR